MALFTDGPPADIETLKRFETAILSVASIEGVDLETKLGLAAEEIGDDLMDFLLTQGSRDPRAAVRRQIGLSDVVVTPQVKRWHAIHTLEIVYRDTFNNQLNDRYQGKWDEYKELTADMQGHALRFGVGLVTEPIERAETPELGSTPGVFPSTTYYVQAAWTSAGGEGAPSAMTAFVTPAGSQLTITAVNPPAVATGWNVYIGLSEESVTRQNSAPLEPGATFTLPAQGPVEGDEPGDGQAPDTYVFSASLVQRG